MDQFLAALPLLACPVGMGAMMWWMSRHRGNDDHASQGSGEAGELTRMRAELDQLRAAHEDRTRAAEQNSGGNA